MAWLRKTLSQLLTSLGNGSHPGPIHDDHEERDAFPALLDAIADFLSPRGFRRRGQRFLRKERFNWSLVEFQKGQRSLQGTFCINLGTNSERVVNEFRGRFFFPGQHPSAADAWFSERLSPDGYDHWWPKTTAASLDLQIHEITLLLNEKGLPRLECLTGEDVILAHLWEQFKRGAVLAPMYAECLVYLLGESGNTERLAEVLDSIETTLGKQDCRELNVDYIDWTRQKRRQYGFAP